MIISNLQFGLSGRGLIFGSRIVFQQEMDGEWAVTLEDLPAFGSGMEVGGEVAAELAQVQAMLDEMFRGTAGFVERIQRGREVSVNKMAALGELGELYRGAVRREAGDFNSRISSGFES